MTMSVLGMSITRTTQAGNPPNCSDVINACDIALKDKQSQIEIRDLRIKESQDEISRQTKVITDQDSKLNSIFRNPWVYGALGLAAGAYLMRK